jgi:fucose permease
VADTLPARGVAVGAAMGALMASVSGMLVPLAWGRLSTAGGDQAISLGVAGSAACALLVVALLAWLVRQEPETAG